MVSDGPDLSLRDAGRRETPSSSSSAFNYDYQIQLMLMEQQDKKRRLLMAMEDQRNSIDPAAKERSL